MNTAGCFPKPAVSAIILDEDRILLVRRGCEPNKGLWSLPGGSIELGETAREAVVREVAEETGLIIEPTSIAGIRDVIAREDGKILFHYVIISFYATVISGTLAPASDAAELRWIPVGELPCYETTPGLIDWLADIGLESRGKTSSL